MRQTGRRFHHHFSRVRVRARDAAIRVYDDAGKVIEAHEHAGKFKEW
jgi:hypothetical protein